MSLNFRQTPIFVFPNCLKFFLSTKNSHTQVLTLYSPYDFPVRYKVQCHAAAWEKYIVPNAEGTVPPQNSVDLVITHKHAVPSNCNIMDKFKIVFQDPATDQIIGKKTIESILLPGEKDSRYFNDDDFEFHSSHDGSSRSLHGAQTTRNVQHLTRSYGTTSNIYVIGLFITVCAIILCLPTEPEITKPSSLPSYLHVSHKIQLLAATLLGVFLCVVVRP